MTKGGWTFDRRAVVLRIEGEPECTAIITGDTLADIRATFEEMMGELGETRTTVPGDIGRLYTQQELDQAVRGAVLAEQEQGRKKAAILRTLLDSKFQFQLGQLLSEAAKS